MLKLYAFMFCVWSAIKKNAATKENFDGTQTNLTEYIGMSEILKKKKVH